MVIPVKQKPQPHVHESGLIHQIIKIFLNDIIGRKDFKFSGYGHYYKQHETYNAHTLIIFDEWGMCKEDKLLLIEALDKAKKVIKEAYVNFEYVFHDGSHWDMDFEEIYGRHGFGMWGECKYKPENLNDIPWYVKKYGKYTEEQKAKRKQEFHEQRAINRENNQRLFNFLEELKKEYSEVIFKVKTTLQKEEGSVSWRKQYTRQAIEAHNVYQTDVSILNMKLIEYKQRPENRYLIKSIEVFPMSVKNFDEDTSEYKLIYDTSYTEN